MTCKNCGKEISDDGLSFCPYCNSYLKNVSSSDFSSYDTTSNFQRNEPVSSKPEFSSYDTTISYQNSLNSMNQLNNVSTNFVSVKKEEKSKKKIEIKKVIPYFLVVILWGLAIYFLFLSGGRDYFFKDDVIKASSSEIGEIDPRIAEYEAVSKSGQTVKKAKTGVTSIIYDNQYLKQTTLTNVDDVYKMIVTDSLKQKSECGAEVVAIENEIVSNYGLKAINLCEMDVDFAEELRDVIAYIYNEFPTARNHMTNITLANVDENATFMAAFMPIFTFATSNTKNGYPVGFKTQIILNAKYFLNSNKIDSSVSYGVKIGYFPPNATRSSTVAHEFGHYLSYVALLNYYHSGDLTFVKNGNGNLMVIYNDFNDGDYSKKIINDAYLVYKQSGSNTMSFDEFRGSISKYALSKDANGDYIYDETIAEAFHDCYLNGDNAKLASKLIINELKSHL